jgi:hypothetical protein
MVKARSLKICPAKPCTNMRGTKTTTVVKVEALTAIPTSPAPSIAAARMPRPPSRFR